MKLFLSDCKNLQSFDVSHSYGGSEHFAFIGAMAQHCFIKNFNMDNLETEISDHMADMGKSFALNEKLEVLSMKDCKAKVHA